MKRILLYLVLVFFTGSLSSQCVSIELSVVWEEGMHPTIADSVFCFPNLSITYRNNTADNIYFLRISGSDCGLPKFPVSGLLNIPAEDYYSLDYLARSINSLWPEFGNDYTVNVEITSYKGYGWIVTNDTIDPIGASGEDVIDGINDGLSEIYRYLYYKNCLNKPSTSYGGACFIRPDITEEGILTRETAQFVFLKPGESETDYFNLIGLKMLGGNYTFKVYPERLTDYVNVEDIFDEDGRRWIEQRASLPLKVGDYRLYAGKILTNEVRIKIAK